MSASTVSRALSGKGSLSAATRATVQIAAARANVGSLAIASPMDAQRTVALLWRPTQSTFTRFEHEMISGMAEGASDIGVRLSVVTCDDRETRRLAGDPARLIAAVGCDPDGLILLGWHDEPALTGLLGRWRTVSLSRLAGGFATIELGLDHLHAGRLLVGHLRAAGHHRIGFIRGRHRDDRGHERQAGFLASVEDGVIVDLTGGDDRDADRRWANAMVGGTTAWVCDSIMTATWAITAARRRGLAVPRDVSLASFSGLPATIEGCAVTCLSLPLRILARTALALLQAPWHSCRPGGRLLLEAELVAGASTAAPRKGHRQVTPACAGPAARVRRAPPGAQRHPA